MACYWWRWQLNTRAVEIEHLKLQSAKLQRMQFGGKSDKLDYQIEPLELQLEDLQADEAEAAREMPATYRAPRKKSVQHDRRSGMWAHARRKFHDLQAARPTPLPEADDKSLIPHI